MKTDHLIHIQFSSERSLQEQIREHLVEKINQGVFSGKPLPSCRKLAQMLRVSRNTVVLVYEQLVDEGILTSHQRRGFYLNPQTEQALRAQPQLPQVREHSARYWQRRLKLDLGGQRNIAKTANWQQYPYPFLFGQPQQSLFPSHHWRECGRLAQRQGVIKSWLSDHIDSDDPMLIKQLQTNVLYKRGIIASEKEILITIGTQNSLFLLAQLLTDATTVVGVEDPGYPDARNIFATQGANIQPLALDSEGVALSERLKQCDYIYSTPSHQVPTNVTMSLKRREQLLQLAREQDMIIIEDDYDSEINLNAQPLPSLKSLDKDDRVIYTGSLSKSLSPGLRIGFMVANESLINAVRKLRRLMYRHPPSNNQRVSALFISMGYYDSYLAKLRKTYAQKWQLLRQALERYLPHCMTTNTLGGSAFWLRLPEGVGASSVCEQAKTQGILVENGDIHFISPELNAHHYLRLGFSAIEGEAIEPGIIALAQVIDSLTPKAELPLATHPLIRLRQYA